mgnify:CR=1 FL=1
MVERERKLREKGERKQKGVVGNNIYIIFNIIYIYIMGILEKFRNFVGGRTRKRRTKSVKSRRKSRGKTRKKTRRKRRKRQKGGS